MFQTSEKLKMTIKVLTNIFGRHTDVFFRLFFLKFIEVEIEHTKVSDKIPQIGLVKLSANFGWYCKCTYLCTDVWY